MGIRKKKQIRRSKQFKKYFKQQPFKDADNFRARLQGFSGTATAGTTTAIEHTLTEERFTNGTHLILKDHVTGDSVDFEIVDKSYSFAGILYPADYNGTAWSIVAPTGVVLDKFGDNWFVSGDSESQHPNILSYPGRLLAGMTIRVTYHSTGGTDVKVYCNNFLHKKSS